MGAIYRLLYQVLVNVIPTGTFCKLRRHYDLLTFSLKTQNKTGFKMRKFESVIFSWTRGKPIVLLDDVFMNFAQYRNKSFN